ncbi:MAG: hypothetical protein MPW14_23200 [Candidatus Manganitrophus sp.]|nr:hypothetical protein [Candidatus Manganitrophus sp.]WDT72555.1 MAG: hypothetical protein MPW17_06880 [Candidatus Manganitrophus sp.]WDT79988.1 MAG: hypothetical protein MPW14_23200 [Candidatus Manganitrophus sp.]
MNGSENGSEREESRKERRPGTYGKATSNEAVATSRIGNPFGCGCWKIEDDHGGEEPVRPERVGNVDPGDHSDHRRGLI